MQEKKSLFQEYRRRVIDIPNQLARQIVKKYDTENCHVYVHEDSVRVSVGTHGLWVRITIKKKKLGPLPLYEFTYLKDGRIKKKFSFGLGKLIKLLNEADIINIKEKSK